MFELMLVAIALLVFASLVIQDRIGARSGRSTDARTLLVVLALYAWGLLQLFWFAPGGLYFSLIAGPVAFAPFLAVSLSGFVLGVRLLVAASYLLRRVHAEERLARIVRHSHLHHLAVFIVFALASVVIGIMGSFGEAAALLVYVSTACAIGGLVGAALGHVALSDLGSSRYSVWDAEEAA
jgi:hypothetical protein